MNNKSFRKFEYSANHRYYVIEEDLVGWYLIVYNESSGESSNDYLFDTFEDALLEAKDRFHIEKNNWKEILKKSNGKR